MGFKLPKRAQQKRGNFGASQRSRPKSIHKIQGFRQRYVLNVGTHPRQMAMNVVRFFGFDDVVNRFLDAQTNVTQGATQFQFNPTASYDVGKDKKLKVMAYYARNFTNPFVSSQFYQSTDRAGIQVVFKLGE